MTINDNNEIRNLFVNKKYKEIINISSIEGNFNDAVSVGGSSIMSGGSIKSGLGTSSILLNSMQISGASRVV